MKRIVINQEMRYDAYEMWKENPELKNADFADLMNNRWEVELSESAWRKLITEFEKMAEVINPAEVIVDRELRLKRLIQEKKTVVKAANTAIDKIEAKKVLEDIRTKFNNTKPIEPKKVNIEAEGKEKEVPVYVISDMQESGAKFSYEVFAEVKKGMIEDIVKNEWKEVYILENGDGIDGVLRVSDLYNNEGGYVDQILIYAQALQELLESVQEYAKVNFSIINSNHTELRPMGTSRGQVKREDVTLIIFNWLVGALKDKNVTFLNKNVDNCLQLNYNIIEINGFKVFHHHGDMRYSNSNKPIQTFDHIRSQYGADIDIAILAHYHHTTLLKHHSKEIGRRGDKQILYVPALDPRQNKQNEIEMGVGSEPSWTKLTIAKDEGIRKLEFIRTGVYK
jgi:hypothetical protein